MSFSKHAFSPEERARLKERVKELEKELSKLKEVKVEEDKPEPNSLEDILC